MKKFYITVLVRGIILIAIFGVIMGICYLVSRHYHYSYMRVIEYAGMILIGIGGLSMLGDLSIRSDVADNQTKLSAKWSRGLQEDIKLAASSRVFCVCMGIAGVILIVIPAIFIIR